MQCRSHPPVTLIAISTLAKICRGKKKTFFVLMAQCFYSGLPFQLRGIANSSLHSRQLDASIPERIDLTKRAFVIRPGVETAPAGAYTVGTRVFVVSDLHTDYSENMCWVKSLSGRAHANDVLVVAGDVAETYANFVHTMSLLKDKFQHVFFVPGNHDLWLRRETLECVSTIRFCHYWLSVPFLLFIQFTSDYCYYFRRILLTSWRNCSLLVRKLGWQLNPALLVVWDLSHYTLGIMR